MTIRILSELQDKEVLEAVVQVLKETFREEVVMRFVEKITSEEFYNSARRQYNAREIVKRYLGQCRSGEFLLLIVDDDIYVSGLNFVFGLAWQNVAIVSACRLRQEFYGLKPDRKLFMERLMKEAVHEIGHLHGLDHCGNRRCVMAFSNWIGDTDHKSWRLCSDCSQKLGH
jgi:archaemetzincin